MLNKDIITNYEALVSLRGRDSLTFPAKVAYAITRNLRILQPIYEDAMTTKQSIIEQYGVPVPERPGIWNITDKKAFDREADSFDNIENDITVYKIPFESIENLNLSVSDMDALYFMLDES